MLPPGSKAGVLPAGKERPPAPREGEPLPEATLDEFFCFLQCQLRMELLQHTKNHLKLCDKEAEQMWPDVEAFITPNLGATERWVPYHTILGVHELFLVEKIHSRKDWSDKQKFQAMFIFRAHCKRDLFMQAQLPIMEKKQFWSNPVKAFSEGGEMEKSILNYRKKTGNPLITSCFRIIPPRVLKDDDANLVRSIISRTDALLRLSDEAWPVVQHKSMSAADKMKKLSVMIQETPHCGETWAKMLTCCMDLAYPNLKLLESQCDVGTGAAPPLKCLMGQKCSGNRTKDLMQLQQQVNSSKSKHAQNFWKTLGEAEDDIKNKFKQFPLICAQAKTQKQGMSAVTLQVQLCEYRQYRHSLARLQYGLADDENMRGEPDAGSRSGPDNYIEVDEKRKVVTFVFPEDASKKPFDVPLKPLGGRVNIGKRVAYMCFKKLQDEAPRAEVEKLRDDLVKTYVDAEDVPDDSEAWKICRVSSMKDPCAVVGFQRTMKDGSTVPFQTTIVAAGGYLEAERVARLCWAKFEKGASKDDVKKYRDSLYKKRGSIEISPAGRPVQKRAKK